MDETPVPADEPASAPTPDPAPIVAEPTPVKHSWRRRHWRLLTVLTLILVPSLLFAGWVAISLSFAFEAGERAGFVQKLSRQGWLCKTWEGELTMVNLPGAMPETFRFTIRNDSLAMFLEQNMGKRVSLSYDQHRGVPTRCFGETEYYITNVRVPNP